MQMKAAFPSLTPLSYTGSTKLVTLTAGVTYTLIMATAELTKTQNTASSSSVIRISAPQLVSKPWLGTLSAGLLRV